MHTKPTLEDAALRLRIDPDLLPDLQAALDQAHDQALAYLDRPLFEDAAAKTAAVNAATMALLAATTPAAADAAQAALERAQSGIAVTHDILAAQLLLADRLMGDNDTAESERKLNAAHALLYAHRPLAF